jgi:hypothetical protein
MEGSFHEGSFHGGRDIAMITVKNELQPIITKTRL